MRDEARGSELEKLLRKLVVAVLATARWQLLSQGFDGLENAVQMCVLFVLVLDLETCQSQ